MCITLAGMEASASAECTEPTVGASSRTMKDPTAIKVLLACWDGF